FSANGVPCYCANTGEKDDKVCRHSPDGRRRVSESDGDRTGIGAPAGAAHRGLLLAAARECAWVVQPLDLLELEHHVLVRTLGVRLRSARDPVVRDPHVRQADLEELL